uniref:Glycosylphosphatidylinositol anchor attachment 1 protein n=1 Tax=Heterorhabditis bacteriophora TaxID=37862 RepID=A0A1I7XC41_HETBA
MRSLVTSSGQRHHLLQKVLDKPGLWGLLCYISAIYYAQYILNRKNAEPTRISTKSMSEFSYIRNIGTKTSKYPQSQAKRSDHGRYINIELNYLNGQLPNLDLFNSVVRIAGTGKFALHSLVYNVKDYDKRGRDWHMLVPLRFIYTQAFVSVEGMHSVLGKYGVQGVSISLPSISSYPMRQSTRLLEAIARSMNNILERFHQSYFIYILASEESFVSIAYFMPVIGGIIAPLLMFAYRDWALMASFYIPTSYLLLHLIGFMIWIISSVHFSHYTHNVEQDIFLFGIVTLIPWGLLIPVTDSSSNIIANCPYPSSFRCLRFLLLLECSLLTGVVSLLNFSLAFCFAIIAVPIIIKLTQENDNRLRSIIRIICGFCCHPFNLYVIFLIYVLPYLGYGRKSMQINLNTVCLSGILVYNENFYKYYLLFQFTSVFLRLVQEHLTFGSNMLPFLLVFVLPIWNLFSIAISGNVLVEHPIHYEVNRTLWVFTCYSRVLSIFYVLIYRKA